ncbi:MAG TPA: ACT domain-containing protein [Spirochaetota bacterium]|nr:ACT domain-containing protein [Spirochaetota bacterium]HPN82837.1 ACT domain-containing protein [Spirochaetota bacterium]
MAHTLTVFMENKPGKLERITGILADAGVNLRGITVASGGEFGVVRVLVTDHERAMQVLRSANLTVSVQESIVAVVEDEPGGFHRLLGILTKNNINIEDCYGFVLENSKKAAIVIDVTDRARAEEILRGNGIEFWKE